MGYEAAGDDIRILVVNKTAITTDIAPVAVTLRYGVANIPGSTLAAEMDFNSHMLSSVILTHQAELYLTSRAHHICWTSLISN